MKKLNEARERHSFKNICTSVEKFYTWMSSEKLRYIVVNKIQWLMEVCYSTKEKTCFFFILFFCFWFRLFINWVVRELFLANAYKIIFGQLILRPCTFKIQHSLIYFLKTQVSFTKHNLENYFKNGFLDFKFHYPGNKPGKSN